MKKILSVLAMVAVVSSALAQGTINFVNNNASLVNYRLPNEDSPAAAVPVNGGFLSLLWAPANATVTSPWDPKGGKNLTDWLAANPGWSHLASFTKAISGAPGRFSSTIVTVPTADPIKVIVVGWTGSSASFDQAYTLSSANPATAAVGMSNPFTVDPEAVGSTTPSPSIVTAGFNGMTLTPTIVPEPSTFALAGLGAAALLIFRRRK